MRVGWLMVTGQMAAGELTDQVAVEITEASGLRYLDLLQRGNIYIPCQRWRVLREPGNAAPTAVILVIRRWLMFIYILYFKPELSTISLLSSSRPPGITCKVYLLGQMVDLTVFGQVLRRHIFQSFRDMVVMSSSRARI